MEFTIFLSYRILFSSWDRISAMSDNIVLPTSGNSITCGLKVTHFWVANKSIQYVFPQSFCFWDRGRLALVHVHLLTCHLSEAEKQVLWVQSQHPLLVLLSLSFLLSSCVLGSSTSFLPHHQPPLVSGLLDLSGSLLVTWKTFVSFTLLLYGSGEMWGSLKPSFSEVCPVTFSLSCRRPWLFWKWHDFSKKVSFCLVKFYPSTPR